MSQVLAWICLVLVASAAAYGVQLAAAAMVPSHAAADQVTSATVARKLWIVAVDPVTGSRAQVECDGPSNTFATDLVLVDANDLAAVAQACNGDDALAVRR
jgi:hypothetical protein